MTQSNIYLVHAGVVRNNPDYYPLVVMNEIVGGGFSGRLMNKIRSQMGLAYGVSGGVNAEWDHPGLFRVWMGTKSGTTMEAINAVRGEISNLATGTFTEEELSQAKESILNAFVFTMDSKAKILNQQMSLEFYGYPANYWDQYAAAIGKVSVADVTRVARKYVQPNQAAMLVVGNQKDFDKPLTSLGTVTPIDVTIPEPGAAPAGTKPAASTAEATALVKKIQDFVGGKAAIDAVQSVRMTGTMSRVTPQGPMDIEVDMLTKYPDAHRNVIKSPNGEMTFVSTADSAFMTGPMGTQDLPGSQRAAMQSDARQELLTVLKNAEKPDYTFSLAGTEKVSYVNAQVLEINSGGSTFKWYVDPATGRILRKVAQGRMGEQVTDYTEWKKFGSLNLPVTFTVSAGGQPAGGGKVTMVEINPPVDPTVFEKPAAK